MDDVQYLRDHGTVDSITTMIDSGRRDYTFYPTPSEYVVKFKEPIKMVTGLEILDGTIPSTMYNVDIHNNLLKLYLIKEGPTINFDKSSADAVDHPSYQAIFAEFGTLPKIVTYLDRLLSDHHKKFLVVSREAFEDSIARGFDPQEFEDPEQNAFSSPRIFMVRSVFRPRVRTVGVDRYKNNPDYAIVEFHGNVLTDALVEENGVFVFAIHKDEPGFTEISTESTLCVLQKDKNDKLTFVHYHPFETTDQSIIEYKSGSLNEYFYEFDSHFIFLRTGNHNIDMLQDNLNFDLNDLDFEVAPPNDDTNPDFGFKFQFTNEKSAFVFDFDRSTSRDVLGFDLFAGNSTNTRQHMERRGDGRQTVLERFERIRFGNRFRLYGSIFDESRATWSIVSPGIINLSGVRYAILRCKEIEEHMNKFELENHNSNGLGSFKLAGSNEITFVRFDFMSVSRRPFHPIGKLDRLSLRFEMSDGNLYDFKGVNHQILINIKYMISENRIQFGGSVLNPSYNPDILAYSLARSNFRVEEEAHGDAREALQDGAYADGADVQLLKAMGGGYTDQFGGEQVDDREFDYSSDDSFEEDYHEQRDINDAAIDSAHPLTRGPPDSDSDSDSEFGGEQGEYGSLSSTTTSSM